MFFTKMMRAVDHPYITGPGGRKANNGKGSMQGLTLKSLKHHVALQPLFAIIGAGCIFVGAYLYRLAAKTTDINWRKEKNPANTYGYYDGKQFKFMNPSGIDYSKYGQDRPKFE
ncbi:cytochrome c oxidase subunit NDUFA4 [Eurytemora carolleeae]|uniref:cytochrome c oxidase subunit NDUFA4 n=1 Tax=Eurytemora carolleeae TaxID=1294199 RepID=UPI000C75C070|nr:cytochrome c oxidase subunit NDUFA4 [Eurytemora carolleeae]|eukprot:XP_023324705.1 cytochrome c oxidase subunit NDUFA4-like [Eurytemora affinis]